MVFSNMTELFCNSFFHGLDEKSKESLNVGYFEERSFEKGQTLIKQNTSGREMFLIKTGDVVITKIISDVEIELSRRSSGEYIGEMSLLDGKLRSANVTAVTKVSVFIELLIIIQAAWVYPNPY